jgi:hypothetical protein
MTRALSNRIGKLEAIGKPIVRVPHVLHVRRGETSDEARARFTRTYPDIPRGHRLLIVPERDRGAEADADFEIRFKEQQTKLIAEARSENRKVAQCSDNHC